MSLYHMWATAMAPPEALIFRGSHLLFALVLVYLLYPVAVRADATLELVALDLRIGTNAVGEIVGATTTEDLLDSIFSTFCIGK